MKTRAIGILLLMLIAAAPASAEPLTWTWTAPTDGTPVVHYIVWVSVDGGEFMEMWEKPTVPEIVIDQNSNSEYLVQAAGIDADGHVGERSQVSDPDVWGAPGSCGKPGRL